MERLRSKVQYHIVLSVLLVLSGLSLAACGDDAEEGPGGNAGTNGGDGDGDGDNGDGDGDGDGDNGDGDGDGDGDNGDGDGDGDGDNGDGDGDGDNEACESAAEPETNDEFLNRPCPPTECEPFDNEDRLPFYVPGEPLPDSLD